VISLPKAAQAKTLPLSHHGRRTKKHAKRRAKLETPEQRKQRLRREELTSAAAIVERRAEYPPGSLIVSWAERELTYEQRLQKAALESVSTNERG
jgi:hypothetical protein